MRPVTSSTRFCKISSVISSSSKTTVSLIDRRPRLNLRQWLARAESQSASAKGLSSRRLSALDAFGNFHFFFAGEERRCPHLAQINSHRVAVRLRSSLRQCEIDVLRFFRKLFFQCLPGQSSIAVQKVKPLRTKSGKQIVRVPRKMHVRNQVIPLVVSQIAFSFSASISF